MYVGCAAHHVPRLRREALSEALPLHRDRVAVPGPLAPGKKAAAAQFGGGEAAQVLGAASVRRLAGAPPRVR